MAHDPSVIPAEMIDADDVWTLEELCLSCNVDPSWIAALVEHGVFEPVGAMQSDWVFARLSIIRLAKAKRLQRDLGLNAPGVALALDLLDQIEDLRAQLASQRRL